MSLIRKIAVQAIAIFLLPLAGTAQKLELTPTGQPGLPSHRLAWDTDDGLRYRLEKSTNLQTWTTMPGFPRASNSLADEFLLNPSGGQAFFRVVAIDEQPPEIVRTFPEAGAFGISRTARIEVDIEDMSGINAASISMRIGGSTPMSLADPRMGFSGDRITFTPGATPMGAPGEVVAVSLTVSDSGGRMAVKTWSFELEVPLVTVPGVFILGTPEAIAAGQVPPGGGTSADPVRNWNLHEVTADTISISYRGAAPTVFTTGLKVCNSQPVFELDGFFRRIESVRNNTAARVLTLVTSEARLGEFISEGSFTVVVTPEQPTGQRAPKSTFEFGKALPTIGRSFGDQVVVDEGDIQLELTRAQLEISSKVTASIEFSGGEVRRFKGSFDGTVDGSIGASLTATAGAAASRSKDLFTVRRHVFIRVGLIPIPLILSGKVQAVGSVAASVQGRVGSSVAQNTGFYFTCDYDSRRQSKLNFDADVDPSPIVRKPLTFEIEGKAQAEGGFEGSVEAAIFGAVGFRAEVNPRFGFRGESTADALVGRRARWTLYAAGDFEANFFISGGRSWTLFEQPLYRSEWVVCYPKSEEVPSLSPDSTITRPGKSVTLTVAGCAPETARYRWFHKGKLVPGLTGDTYHIARLDERHNGEYHVEIEVNGALRRSNVAVISVEAYQVDYEIVSVMTDPVVEKAIPDPNGNDMTWVMLSAESAEPDEQVGAQLRYLVLCEFDEEAGTVIVKAPVENALQQPDGGGILTFSGSYNAGTGDFQITLNLPREIYTNELGVTYTAESNQVCRGRYDAASDTFSGTLTEVWTLSWDLDSRKVRAITVGRFSGK